MKTIVIKEFEKIPLNAPYSFDISKKDITSCCGCWTCWWTTPGRCVYKDLDELYHEYLTADRAVFFVKVKKGFVSSNLKSLFDRMIPHYLPYITTASGESMHLTRYDKYPDIYFYYDGSFSSEERKKIYEDYIHRVFFQFHSKNIIIKPMSEYKESDLQ